MMLLSIIIATRNRCRDLEKIFESIVAQEISGGFDFEIIIVDNNSTDGTKGVVEKMQGRTSRKVRYFFEPKKGKSYAINAGVGQAEGDILVFTDDDTVADRQWLLNIFECFRAYGCDGVGGRILPVYPPQTPAWIKENSKLLRGPIVNYDYGEEVLPYAKPIVEFLGANMAFRKEVFREFGLFNVNLGPGLAKLGEDTEFVKRLIRGRKSLYYCGKALVWHPVDDKRMSLRYIAHWNRELGKYRFIIDENSAVDESLKCACGIPCYLIRQIMTDGAKLVCYIFNRGQFIKVWIRLSINLGKAQEMRKQYLDNVRKDKQ